MVFGWRRTTRFARALRAYGLDRCSVGGSTIWIGLGPDPDHGRKPLDRVPDAPRALCFVAAPVQADLVRALAASREAETLERLMIGTSHDFAAALRKERIDGGYDMREAVAALRGASFPVLNWLSLGDMEMLFNGHRLLGRIGDVAPVFASAPHLETLCLCGQFSLAAPLSHAHLRSLSVELDDIGVSGGPVSQETVTNLLSSSFPVLSELALRLEEQDRPADYDVPEAFLAGAGMPSLKVLEMDSLTADAHARLSAWAARRNLPVGPLKRGVLS